MSQTTTEISKIGWRFENTYARLPEIMLSRLPPVPVKSPKLVILNHTLSKELGLNFSAIADEDIAFLQILAQAHRMLRLFSLHWTKGYLIYRRFLFFLHQTLSFSDEQYFLATETINISDQIYKDLNNLEILLELSEYE